MAVDTTSNPKIYDPVKAEWVTPKAEHKFRMDEHMAQVQDKPAPTTEGENSVLLLSGAKNEPMPGAFETVGPGPAVTTASTTGETVPARTRTT